MTIRFRPEHLSAIRRHGEATFPDECCGFLVGHLDGEQKVVSETYPVNNARESEARYNRFLIPPQAVMEAEKYARGKRLHILGFYHSHPNAEARPSHFDLDHAWPFYSYVIVSVKNGESRELNSWRMAEDRSAFQPEAITVQDG
ncbi:MAG: M67 family metallopeptidase [Acidobacteriota bacterium]